MQIRPVQPADIPRITQLWNSSVLSGEVVYKPLQEAAFRALFLDSAAACPDLLLVALKEDVPQGFLIGNIKKQYLPGETFANTPAFLTALIVDPSHRHQGMGTALLNAFRQRLAAMGKQRIAISGDNPIKLAWLIPGTPQHDHNNAPGMDTLCPGYPFLLARGFQELHREVAMYLNLSQYVPLADMPQRLERLAQEGITAGRYDPAWRYEFDTMCDRVKSEYWRKVLQDELASPAPRPILAATVPGHFVAFTGPVDKQPGGRGWFTGICTDPLYEKKGIATVLFNLLMHEFIQVGAAFSTLFTGDTNHARKIYERAGFSVARTFSVMEAEV